MSSRIWHNRILEVMADADPAPLTLSGIENALLEKYEGASISKHKIVWARNDLVKEGKIKQSGPYSSLLTDEEPMAAGTIPHLTDYEFKGPLVDFMYLIIIVKETFKNNLLDTIKRAGTEEAGSEMIAANKIIGACDRIIKSYTSNGMIFMLDADEVFGVLRKKIETYNISIDDGLL